MCDADVVIDEKADLQQSYADDENWTAFFSKLLSSLFSSFTSSVKGKDCNPPAIFHFSVCPNQLLAAWEVVGGSTTFGRLEPRPPPTVQPGIQRERGKGGEWKSRQNKTKVKYVKPNLANENKPKMRTLEGSLFCICATFQIQVK